MKKSLNYPIISSYLYRGYDQIDPSFFTTVNIINCAFIEVDPQGNLIIDNLVNKLEKYLLPNIKDKNIYLIVSIAPSSAWSSFCQSAALIENFADQVVDFINQYQLDGVDLDWEYPLAGQFTWFTNLARIVNQKVKANNPHHLVTAAITGGKWQIGYYDILNSSQYLDFINVMTYSLSSNRGYYQSGLYPSSNYHDQSNQVGATNQSCSIQETIEIFNQQYQIPLRKLIMGIPFYGARQVRKYDQDLKIWGQWKSPGAVFYDQIVENYLNNPQYQSHFDPIALVPYLIKTDYSEFISYDNPLSIKYKCQYLKEHAVGGVMFWEYGCDLSNSLYQSIVENLRKNSDD